MPAWHAENMWEDRVTPVSLCVVMVVWYLMTSMKLYFDRPSTLWQRANHFLATVALLGFDGNEEPPPERDFQ